MSTLGTKQSRFSQGKYCTNQFLTEMVFMDFGVDFSRFLEALEAVFLVFFCLENKVENNEILVCKRILRCGCGGADQEGIWTLEAS